METIIWEREMSNNFIPPEEKRVNKIFLEDSYSVPIYQRSYAWEKDQIEQLINDIYDASDKETYFLGSLIVDEQEKHLFSVIDGQQRLTTLYLIMAYLNKELLKANCLTFEAREESNRVLSVLLNTDFSDDKDFDGDDSYNDEIIAGVKRIQAFFRTKDDNYKNTIIHNFSKVILIRTQVPKNIDLNHYFEIMNTRGEQLELHEIAKGRILSKITSSFDKKIAAQIWDACAHMDEYIQMCFPIDIRYKLFDTNWNNFTCNSFDDIREKYIELEKEKLQKINKDKNIEPIINDNEKSTAYSLFKLIKEDSIQQPSEKNGEEENERFESIVSFPNFLLLVNEALFLNKEGKTTSLDDKDFLDNLKHIWNSADKEEANKSSRDFIYEMLKMKFLFDTYILKREFAKDYKDEGKWSLQRLERISNNGTDKPKYVTTFFEIDEDDNTMQNIRTLQSAFRITYTSPKTMHWISSSLNFLEKHFCSKSIQSKDFLLFLEQYGCQKIQESEFESKRGFEIERIVFTYLDYILYRDNKETYSNFQFQFRTSIEHFHPQNPVEHIDDWSKTEEDRFNYLNNFGNLALITVKANSRFSNLSPNSKIDTYPNTLEQSIKLKLMNELRVEYGNWTKAAVLKHGEEMINLIKSEIKSKLV